MLILITEQLNFAIFHVVNIKVSISHLKIGKMKYSNELKLKSNTSCCM